MTTARVLIASAFREGNLIPIGTVPTEAELAEALPRLNRYVRGVFGYEMGEPLMDWPVPQPQRTSPIAANYPQAPYPASLDSTLLPFPTSSGHSLRISQNPPVNSRVVWGGENDLRVYFHEQPPNGARMGVVRGPKAQPTAILTLDGNGRFIDGAATQTLTGAFDPREWLYRADLGEWRVVRDMEIDDECPFPPEHDDLWICLLAIRLAPRYSKQIAPETQATAAAAMRRFKAFYSQTQPTVYGSFDTPRALQSYISGQWWW